MKYKKKKRFGYDGCMKSFWKNAKAGFNDSRNNDKERSRSPPKNNFRPMYQSRDNSSYQAKRYDNADKSEDRYPRREPQQYQQRTEFNPQNRYSQIKPTGFSQSQEKPAYNYTYQNPTYTQHTSNQQKTDYTKTASYQLQHQKYNDLISNKYSTDQRQQQSSLSNQTQQQSSLSNQTQQQNSLSNQTQQQNSLSNQTQQQNSYESFYKAQVPQYKLPETSMVNTNGSSYWAQAQQQAQQQVQQQAQQQIQQQTQQQVQQKSLYEAPVTDKPRPSLASYADSYNNTNNVSVQAPQTNQVIPQPNQFISQPNQSVLTPQQNSTNFDTNSYNSYKKSVLDSYGKENPNSLVSTNASKTKEAPK